MAVNILAVFAIAALLASCGPSAEQLAAADHAQCLELGYVAGTSEYGNCRLAMMQIREQRRASAIAAWGAINSPGTAWNPMVVRPQ